MYTQKNIVHVKLSVSGTYILFVPSKYECLCLLVQQVGLLRFLCKVEILFLYQTDGLVCKHCFTVNYFVPKKL